MQHALSGGRQLPQQHQQRRCRSAGGAAQQQLRSSLACSHHSRHSRRSLRVAAAASTEAAPDSSQQVVAADAAADTLSEEKQEISKLLNRPYKYGFKTIIESETFPKGLSEDVVRAISAKKHEPEWLLEFRLKAYRRWLTMKEPAWSDNHYPRIDFQDLSYYSEPKMKEKKASLEEVDPELLRTFDKLVGATLCFND